jgi:hypothetical protein
MNLIEELRHENQSLREENQRLRDENNRLKGEQGKPDIKASKTPGKTDISSEKERRQEKKWHKVSKKDKIHIDRKEILTVDQSCLPEDAQFKGYEDTVVQDILIKTDNVCFRKEKYYSESESKCYTAKLPAGYDGQFGPGVRSLIITFYYASGMTEPKIVEFFQHIGIVISEGQVSNILTKKHECWHKEKDEIFLAGISSTSWQHIDDTATRVDGKNEHCHIVCNPLYTFYSTRARKDRLTVIAVLQNTRQLCFLFNNETIRWFEQFSVPKWAQREIENWPKDESLSQQSVFELLERDLLTLNDQQCARVLEAGALTFYHNQKDVPVVCELISDDAPQFRYVTEQQGLCWVHEGRPYKKLSPLLEYHEELLSDFREDFWDFYKQLQHYKTAPSEEKSIALGKEFDKLFSTETKYTSLDNQIKKTLDKKEELLLVLRNPEVPLHNNPAELGARQRVCKRDVSFGPRTDEGTNAWDTFMTIVETAKKLGVSFYSYIYDRISGKNDFVSLAELIQQRTMCGAFEAVG